MAARQLLQGLEDKWEKSVSHEFIAACTDASIKPEQFNRWLCQDYYFVRGFAPYAGACLASCPDKHIEVLVSGVGALEDELRWFKETIVKRGIDIDTTTMQPTCIAYRAFLRELMSQPYAVQAAAFWAIEAAYHEAWAHVLDKGISEEYKQYGHRWGNPGFGAYVKQLEGHADEALALTPELTDAARSAVARVVDLELGFWAMAYYNSPPAQG